MTVGELLSRISSRELTEWMAYYSQEPFGEVRGDLQSAIVAAMIANVNRDPKRQRQAFEVEEFMPKFWNEFQHKGADEIYSAFKTWALLHKTKDES